MLCIVLKADIGEWLTWSSWSECSRTCGTGLKNRSRDCNGTANSCYGDLHQAVLCEEKECLGKQKQNNTIDTQSVRSYKEQRQNWHYSQFGCFRIIAKGFINMLPATCNFVCFSISADPEHLHIRPA